MTHSPEILNFVLVDFKGGATFAGMAGMPHVSAIITNLADELTLVDRMQDALSGEMTRRQELLRASGNYASLRDYEKDRTSATGPTSRRCPACSSSATSSASCSPPSRSSSTCSSRSGGSAGRSASTCCSPRSGSRRVGCAAWTATCRTGSACAPSRPASRAASSAWATPTSCPPSRVSGSSSPTSPRCCGSRRPTCPVRPAPGAAPVGRRRLRPPRGPAVRPRRGGLAAGAGGGRRARAAEESPSRSGGKRTVFDIAVAGMTGHGPAAHRVWLPPLDVPDTFDQMLPDLAVDPELGLVSRSWRSARAAAVPARHGRHAPRAEARDAPRRPLRRGRPRRRRRRRPGPGSRRCCGPSSPGWPSRIPLARCSSTSSTSAVARSPACGTCRTSPASAPGRSPTWSPGSSPRWPASSTPGAVLPGQRRRHDRDLPQPPGRSVKSDDGYGDIFLVVDGWSTIRSDFDELRGRAPDAGAAQPRPSASTW